MLTNNIWARRGTRNEQDWDPNQVQEHDPIQDPFQMIKIVICTQHGLTPTRVGIREQKTLLMRILRFFVACPEP